MNQYGARVMEFWRAWRPAAFAQLGRPSEATAFFAAVGEQVQERVQLLCEDLQAVEVPPLAGLDYLTRVGRLTAIRRQAEEIALSEALGDPEEPGESTQGTEPGQTDRRYEQMDSFGMPRDTSHPLWQMAEDPNVPHETFLAAAHAWENSLTPHPDPKAQDPKQQ